MQWFIMLISWDKVRHGQSFVLSNTLIFSLLTIFTENHEYTIFAALRSSETRTTRLTIKHSNHLSLFVVETQAFTIKLVL